MDDRRPHRTPIAEQRWSRRWTVVVAVLALLGVALVGAPSAGAATENARPSVTSGLHPCAWPLVSDPETLNVAAPDYWATYWTTPLLMGPGTTYTISGQFPHARFASFETYDATGAEIDSIADYQLPATTGKNPFADATADPSADNRFQIRIQPTAPLSGGASSTLRGLPVGSTATSGFGFVLYRIYLGDGGSRNGSVDLPTVSVTRAGRTTELPTCRRTDPNLSAASATPRRPAGLGATAGCGTSGTDLCWTGNSTAASSGLFANAYNRYMGLNLQGAFDPNSLVVLRGRMPTTPTTQAQIAAGGQDLRYWSMSTNNWSGLKPVVSTLADEQVTKDADGGYVIVVSRSTNKPSDAVLAQWGATWIDWGKRNNNQVILLRNMLPAANFTQVLPKAQPAAPTDAQLRAVLGPYYPQARTCPATTFAAHGPAGCGF